MNPAIAPRPSKSLLIGAIVTGMAALIVLAATAGLHAGTAGKRLAQGSPGHLSSTHLRLNEPGEYLVWSDSETRIDAGLVQVRWKSGEGTGPRVLRRTELPDGEARLDEVKIHAPRLWISALGTGKPKSAFTVEAPGEYLVSIPPNGFVTKGASPATLAGILGGGLAAMALGAVAIILGFLHRSKTRQAGATPAK